MLRNTVPAGAQIANPQKDRDYLQTTNARPASSARPPAAARDRRLSILLVFCCTLIGAAAQVLIKFGATGLSPHPSPVQTIIRIFTSPALFTGYALYGVSTVLLVLALRHGELSLLYPVIALTFVWVTVLSVIVFHETMNPLKLAGIVVIMTGVAVLGRGSAITTP